MMRNSVTKCFKKGMFLHGNFPLGYNLVLSLKIVTLECLKRYMLFSLL